MVLPAIQRYDGVLFRVLRKWQAESAAADVDVAIISGYYGLIGAETPVDHYDSRLTTDRARLLRGTISMSLREQVRRQPYLSAFLGLGQLYQSTIEPDVFADVGVPIAAVRGSIGAQAAQLRDWLRQPNDATCPSHSEVPRQPLVQASGSVRICGVELRLTSESVLALAREALSNDPAGSANYASWYVDVDDVRVAPKWLVRILSKLPVSAYSTTQARRALEQLGIPVLPVQGQL